ncbi:MAG: mitochondrial import inner membrane translocase subunit TIM14 [Chaenotheca gracillima]|nr:MAG: mitochondrial import inner membrane translocase subunit TIM14 [Chaenotheca gracillima]
MMFLSLLSAAFAATAVAQNVYSADRDANGHAPPVYSPARPPAIPLAVRSPYTNTWSSTASNGTLNSASPIFWDGTVVGWEGIIAVDGISYEWLGVGSQSLPALPNLRTAVPLTADYDSQYSNFTFAAGPVELTASFLSSVLPKDLCRTSIPLSYASVSAHSTDNKTHDVQLYSDVNGAWISYESNVTLTWDIYQGSNPVTSNSSNSNSSSVYSWLFGLQQPYEFGEESDFPQWGNFTFNSAQGKADNMSFQSGYSSTLRYGFVMNHTLQDLNDPNPRGSGAQEPVFAFAHDLGQVGSEESSIVTYTLGSVQEPIIRYLTSGGIVGLTPWWSKCYGTIFDMINFHYNDLAKSQILAAQFEGQLKSDVAAYYGANPASIYSNGPGTPPPVFTNHTANTDSPQYIFDSNTAYGFLDPNNFTGVPVPGVDEAEAYYSIVALSARQIMGAYVFAVPPSTGCSNGTSQNTSEPLMFQKEISSDGNVNTVDVMYPAMPFFLYANPELLKYNLNPLFQNQEGGFYPNDYSMHDLGTHYPNATGHVEGDDEYMPVEESGNMILMSYAYYKFSNNLAWLQQHYDKLFQFSQYLIEYSLMPGIQLSTDDFAGQLVNQTNLAIKGIVGIEAMAKVATAVSNSDDAQNFTTTASNYIQAWEYFAVDPSGMHTVLSYEWRSSYGLLYNIYPDMLLDLGIVPQRIYDMQSDWYPTISQVYGIPLDTRHSYTKSDWEMWTAATCSPDTRKLFVNALAYWINSTDTNRAFSDLYETVDDGSYPISPAPIYFIARPVVGGHFSLLALHAAGMNSTGNGTVASVSLQSSKSSALSTATVAGSGAPTAATTATTVDDVATALSGAATVAPAPTSAS